MSSCTECHGAEGSHHTTADCPRWEQKASVRTPDLALASPSPLPDSRLRNELMKIPVRMGKRELGELLSAQEIDQILAYITKQREALLEELEKKWYWFNYAQPNLDKRNHKAVLLDKIKQLRGRNDKP